MSLTLRLNTHSSAAQGFASRGGLGRQRCLKPFPVASGPKVVEVSGLQIIKAKIIAGRSRFHKRGWMQGRWTWAWNSRKDDLQN